MFIELIDQLRCINPHEDTWLVASFKTVSNRFVLEGSLGCPACSAQYPIRDGIADFSAGLELPSCEAERAAASHRREELATRAGAYYPQGRVPPSYSAAYGVTQRRAQRAGGRPRPCAQCVAGCGIVDATAPAKDRRFGPARLVRASRSTRGSAKIVESAVERLAGRRIADGRHVSAARLAVPPTTTTTGGAQGGSRQAIGCEAVSRFSASS